MTGIALLTSAKGPDVRSDLLEVAVSHFLLTLNLQAKARRLT